MARQKFEYLVKIEFFQSEVEETGIFSDAKAALKHAKRIHKGARRIVVTRPGASLPLASWEG